MLRSSSGMMDAVEDLQGTATVHLTAAVSNEANAMNGEIKVLYFAVLSPPHMGQPSLGHLPHIIAVYSPPPPHMSGPQGRQLMEFHESGL